MVLGDDTSEFVVAYVDDVLLFSRSYSEHLSHLNIVPSKLTRAGLTVNALKLILIVGIMVKGPIVSLCLVNINVFF
jgi:hypothetical protein